MSPMDNEGLKKKLYLNYYEVKKNTLTCFDRLLYHVDMKSYKFALSTCCTKLPVVVHGHGLEGHEVQIGCF